MRSLSAPVARASSMDVTEPSCTIRSNSLRSEHTRTATNCEGCWSKSAVKIAQEGKAHSFASRRTEYTTFVTASSGFSRTNATSVTDCNNSTLSLSERSTLLRMFLALLMASFACSKGYGIVHVNKNTNRLAKYHIWHQTDFKERYVCAVMSNPISGDI